MHFRFLMRGAESGIEDDLDIIMTRSDMAIPILL